MSEDALTKIPGTTFYLKFGIEGKHYAVFLCRGSTPFKTKQLNILRGTTFRDLPEEVENGLKYLLDSEEIYISPIVVDRVVNDLLDQIPKDGQVFVQETPEKQYVEAVEKTVKVSDLISKSEDRAEKKSIIEHTPGEKSKFDASADDIGTYKLKQPKPLPHKMDTTPEPVVSPTPVAEPMKLKPTPSGYANIEEKLDAFANEIVAMQELATKNKAAITSLKKQVTTLKNQLKALKE